MRELLALERAVVLFLAGVADARPASFLFRFGDNATVAAVELLDAIGKLKRQRKGRGA